MPGAGPESHGLPAAPKASLSHVRQAILAPLIAEMRRRIAGDRLAMAEPGSIEGKSGELALARTAFLQTLETDWITQTHDVHAHIAHEQHSSRMPQSATCPEQCPGV